MGGGAMGPIIDGPGTGEAATDRDGDPGGDRGGDRGDGDGGRARRRWARPRLPRRWVPRRWWARMLLAVATLLAVGLGPQLVIMAITLPHLHRGTGEVPPAPVAIVLGAGVHPDGTPTALLAERLQVATDLYRSGRVRSLLMSGDNSRHTYDEVGVMARYVEGLGVPASAIVQDHAGFDTYSSCYRARSVWGISRAVVVTQPFHLTRAVWTCRQLGVDAEGAATSHDPGRKGTWYGWLREFPALDKAVLDVCRDRTPTFPGPREHRLDAVTADG